MDRLCSSRGQEVTSLRKIKCVNAAFDTKGRRQPASLGGILKFVTVLIALMALLMSASTRVLAQEEGRIQITFSKAGYGSGSGYLFYQGQKYGLGVSAAKIGKIWVTTIDLIGTASNLQSAADVLGTYNGDPKSALLKRAATARLKNAKGVVLEIRAVNLSRWSKLDLSGMTLKNVGWQSSSE
jgi:hypothetical protein